MKKLKHIVIRIIHDCLYKKVKEYGGMINRDTLHCVLEYKNRITGKIHGCEMTIGFEPEDNSCAERN